MYVFTCMFIGSSFAAALNHRFVDSRRATLSITNSLPHRMNQRLLMSDGFLDDFLCLSLFFSAAGAASEKSLIMEKCCRKCV